MSPQRVALSCVVTAMVVLVGSWGAVSAFPLRASVREMNERIAMSNGGTRVMSPAASLPVTEDAVALATRAGRRWPGFSDRSLKAGHANPTDRA